MWIRRSCVYVPQLGSLHPVIATHPNAMEALMLLLAQKDEELKRKDEEMRKKDEELKRKDEELNKMRREMEHIMTTITVS